MLYFSAMSHQRLMGASFVDAGLTFFVVGHWGLALTVQCSLNYFVLIIRRWNMIPSVVFIYQRLVCEVPTGDLVESGQAASSAQIKRTWSQTLDDSLGYQTPLSAGVGLSWPVLRRCGYISTRV